MNSWPMKMMTVPAGHRPVELTGRIARPWRGRCDEGTNSMWHSCHLGMVSIHSWQKDVRMWKKNQPCFWSSFGICSLQTGQRLAINLNLLVTKVWFQNMGKSSVPKLAVFVMWSLLKTKRWKALPTVVQKCGQHAVWSSQYGRPFFDPPIFHWWMTRFVAQKGKNRATRHETSAALVVEFLCPSSPN